MDMLSLNQEDVSKELKDSKNIIEDKIGKKIKYSFLMDVIAKILL